MKTASVTGDVAGRDLDAGGDFEFDHERGVEAVGMLDRPPDRLRLGRPSGGVEVREEPPGDNASRPFGLKFATFPAPGQLTDRSRVSLCPERQISLIDGVPVRQAREWSDGRTVCKIQKDGRDAIAFDVETDD